MRRKREGGRDTERERERIEIGVRKETKAEAAGSFIT